MTITRITSKLESVSSYYWYLSIFRVYLCVHILKKLLFSWSSIELLYDKASFVVHYSDPFLNFFNISPHFINSSYRYIYLVLSLSVVAWMFGFGKRISNFVILVCIFLLQSYNGLILNGGDNLLKFLLIYMLFCDSYQYLNLYSSKSPKVGLNNYFTNVGVFLIIFHLCVVYFIAGLSKVNADLWFKGVAPYYTLAGDRFMGLELNKSLVQNIYFVTFSSYFTMFWEMCFPLVLFMSIKARALYLFAGITLHLGIYILMMIHDFQILYLFCYGFFFRKKDFKSLVRFFRDKLKLS